MYTVWDESVQIIFNKAYFLPKKKFNPYAYVMDVISISLHNINELISDAYKIIQQYNQT